MIPMKVKQVLKKPGRTLKLGQRIPDMTFQDGFPIRPISQEERLDKIEALLRQILDELIKQKG